MRTNKDINEVLNECVDRILTKNESVADCCKLYPEHAAELKELLNTAAAVKKACGIQSTQECKERVRNRWVAVLREEKAHATKKVRSKGAFSTWMPRWSAVVAVIAGFALVGSSTIAAAAYSMPDEALYPVKLATEQAQLTLTFSKEEKAKVYTWLATRRVQEIVQMATQGNAEKIELVSANLDKDLQLLASLGPNQANATGPMVAAAGAPTLSSKVAATQAATVAPSVAPAPTTSAPVAPPSTAKSNDSSYGTVTPRASGPEKASTSKENKIKTIVDQNAVNHTEAIRNAMDKVPENAKSALQNALDNAMAGYQKAAEAWQDTN